MLAGLAVIAATRLNWAGSDRCHRGGDASRARCTAG